MTKQVPSIRVAVHLTVTLDSPAVIELASYFNIPVRHRQQLKILLREALERSAAYAIRERLLEGRAKLAR